MGCLKFIIKVVIVVLAIIGFKSLGGWDYLKENVHFFEKPTQEALLEKAKSIADLSKIPDEYEIDRTADFFGYKAVAAEHKASGQKLIILDPGKSIPVTKKDFKDGGINKKLKELNDKIAYQFVRLENLTVTKQGTFKTMGQTVPYARFEADVVNMPFKHMEGMIAVADIETDDGVKSRILLAANSDDKYSQIITEQFFHKVK